jgi:Acetyltransferase (GNAT) family
MRSAHRLLTQIFPRAEMLPRSAWVHVMRERAAGVWTDLNWHLFVARHRGRIVGAATGTYLGHINVGLIGYVAVRSTARSSGIGPRLRWALHLGFERDANRLRSRPLNALVGEVRPDNPWLRRLVGHGAIALDLPYYQPSLRRSDREVPLVLYYQPLLADRASLSAKEVRQLLYAVWRRAYRISKPLAHPLFRAMLRAIAGRARIGQRRLTPVARPA